MKKHWKYLNYVLRHKWFVFLACCRFGIPFRGLFHDWSKFRPSEWFPYANFFHGKKAKNPRDRTGYYKPTDTGDAAFDFAWLLHQKRNRHHWQWWTLPEDSGKLKVLPMPEKDVREMLCDWLGAARAQHSGPVASWFLAHSHKMKLHTHTQDRIRRWFDRNPRGVFTRSFALRDAVEVTT